MLLLIIIIYYLSNFINANIMHLKIIIINNTKIKIII